MRTLAFLLVLLPIASARADGVPDLSGNWPDGQWHSDKNDHKGPLRARFSRLDCGRYRVVFRGRFFAVVPFRYAVTLDVVGHREGVVLLAGEQRVPFYGTFRYSAEATCNRFTATFESRDDQGTFTLCR